MNNEAKPRTSAHYHKQRGTQVHLWFHDINDADILERLSEVGNKQGYIKSLIRADIAGYEAKRKAAGSVRQ